MNRPLSRWLALVAAVLLSGCSDLAKLIAPAGPGDSRPARVAFTALVVSSNTRSAADIVSLRVTTSYVLTGGRRDTIGSQSLELTSAASQAVPIPVDLAGCLADSKRDGASVDAGCSVVLELALRVNGVVVDRQTVGPLRLSPGATTEVRQPVMLFEIASVSITPTGSLSLTVGGTASITPTVRDIRGQPVDGRPVIWESDNPTVASVDVNGRVTAVSVGQARISATLGALSSSVLVQVARPPVSLVISPAVGTGTGVVRSAPSGIDCRLVNGTVTGVCAFEFAADLHVTLNSTADAGHQFVAWGGACVGSAIGASCTLSMTQPRAASAQFTALRRVTITSPGTDGRGRVSGGFGLDCIINGAATSGTCAVDVPDGSSMMLSSVPDAASAQSVLQVFSGWGNDCASASGATCALTISGNRTVSAGFFAGRSLNVTIDGSGGGSVASVSGIACASVGGRNSGVCAQTLPFGTGVTLFPVGDTQSSFVGWGGACAGQALAMCTLSISETREARATFVRRLIPLTITLSGSGNGTVTVNGVVGCLRTNTQVGRGHLRTGVRTWRDGDRASHGGTADRLRWQFR